MSNRKLLDVRDRIKDNRISKNNLAQELKDLRSFRKPFGPEPLN